MLTYISTYIFRNILVECRDSFLITKRKAKGWKLAITAIIKGEGYDDSLLLSHSCAVYEENLIVCICVILYIIKLE